MKSSKSKHINQLIFKSLAFVLTFVLLHYLYDWTHWRWLQIFSGIRETMVEHMKIGFYSFIILSTAEYFIRRKTISSPVKYLYSRLLGSMLLPWAMFLLWYIAPASYGMFPAEIYDIIYSILITFILAIMTLLLSEEWESMQYKRITRYCIWFLVLNTIFLFTSFTFHIPWAPFF